MKMAYICFIVFAFSQGFAVAAPKKIDETWGSGIRSEARQFDSISSFKKSNKMGLQTTLAGATGLLGLNLNINFTESFEFSLGFGISRGFHSFNGFVRLPMGGTTVSPYFVTGYSRWAAGGSEDGVQNTSPSILAKKFLSSHERKTGEFAENIIYPGLGVQYLQLSGDFEGCGLFAEVLMLVDLDDFVTGPTAGLGAAYYF